MELINIVTRSTRTNHLEEVKKSVYSTDKVRIKWWIVFDTSVVKEVDAQFLSNLNEFEHECLFIKGVPGDYGHGLINKVIDRIEDGWVYFLDDDNILHEDFYEEFLKMRISDPTKKGYIFSQKVGGKDFSGVDIRIASPENTKVQHIDMAQFILKRDLIDDNRLISMEYKADGIFIETLFKKNRNDFKFTTKVLCYYNHLSKKQSFVPKVLYLGEDTPDLKSYRAADYEANELNVKYSKNDDNIIFDLIKFNPDCILTTGNDWSKYGILSNQPLEIRSKWIHIESVKDDTGESAYQCAMRWMLNPDKSDLVSYFTPVYNIGDKVRAAYDSLKKQTYDNWEWVIVNDSTDGGITLRIVEEIASQDHRVKVYDFRTKSGGIVGESKYRAAGLCKGGILAELDHDDYLMPKCTEYLIQASKKYPEAGFFFTDCAEVDSNWNSLYSYGDGFALGYGHYRQEEVFGKNMHVIMSNNINPKTIRHIVGVPNHVRAWRREAYFKAGGYNRYLSIADDYELLVRTFLTTKMVRIPKLGYLQLIHSSGSNTHALSRADIQRRVRTIADYYNEKIRDRFIELGLKDWAYQQNPQNPLWTDSKYGQDEEYANIVYEE